MSDNTDKRYYLTQIQEVVKRMGSNSFVVKGWFITIVAAIYTFYFHTDDVRSLFGVVIIAILFWYHDAYYLSLERSYRKMYDRIRKIDNSLVDFNLTLSPEDKTSIWEGAFRPILVSSYGLVTFGTVVVIAFALGGFYGK